MNKRDSEALRIGRIHNHTETMNYRMQDNELKTGIPADKLNPGEEAIGPLMFNLVEESRRAREVHDKLLQAAIPLLDQRIIVERHAGNTDANGNLDLPLYRVPQGYQLVVTRCIIEDATHTPGAPFSAAGAWIALIDGDRFQPGSVKDFLPNPGNAAAVPLIPGLFSDGNTEAAVFRGGQIVSLHVVGTVTLANVDIFCTLQGHEIPL